jgi:hypothetical protein
MNEQHGGEIDALDRAIRETKAEATPEPDWDRMEEALFDRIDAAEAEEKRPARRNRVLGSLAMAAVIALGSVAILRATTSTEVAENSPTPLGPSVRVFGPGVESVDGASLHEGDRVVAGAAAIVVEHRGTATWTLQPRSEAVVSQVGRFLTIRLESGSVSAKVVPQKVQESFAVEVDHARVAVHGTEFQVTRDPKHLGVVVKEGIVAVGPAATRGQTEGWLLTPGDTGHFAFDGRSGEVVRAVSVTPLEVAGDPRKPSVQLPDMPTRAEVEKRLDSIEQATAVCFTKLTAQDEVRVSAQVRVIAEVAPNGQLRGVSFEPPLAPGVTQCAKSATAGLKFSQSLRGVRAERSVAFGNH